MTRLFLSNTSSSNELNNIDVTRQTFLTAIVKNQQITNKNINATVTTLEKYTKCTRCKFGNWQNNETITEQ